MSAPSRRLRHALPLLAAALLIPMSGAPAVAVDATSTETVSQDSTETTIPLAAPTITGELAVGQRLQAQPDPLSPVELSYQWFADAAPITGATSAAFTIEAAHAGRVINVEVTTTSRDSAPQTVRSTNTLRTATAGRPVVKGTTTQGSKLTVSAGYWTPSASVSYQWLADGRPIAGATTSSFTLTRAQSGKAMAVQVTAARNGYATVSRTSAVAPRRVMAWTKPTISGVVAVGSTLTARPGTWTSGSTFTYQWYADGKAVSGARAATFKLGTGQRDRRISVKVSGAKSGHSSAAPTSGQTGRVMTAPAPTISGTAVVGSTLTARIGTWTTSTKRTYQWYADGAAISRATGSTLKLTSAHRNKAITVKVTGKRSGWATVTKGSKSTQRVQYAPTPTIKGSPRVSSTLTAVPGTAWSSGTKLSYQWYASGTAIKGATGSKLKLGAGHVGRTIKVKVTGRKSGYPTVARTSGSTGKVSYPLVAAPYSSGECPSWAPIKGNANSGIYHVPSGQYYRVTHAEECFRTDAAAVSAGYRKSKR